MVTTRRSSFGIQDGDTLALRSKSTPTSAETTPTRKRKEYALETRSSSRKKPTSSGLDGTDDAPVEAEHPESVSLEDGKPMDEPTSKADADVAIAQAEGAQESTAWLAEDFVPLSTEPSLEGAGAGAEKESDISNTVVNIRLPDDPPTNGLDTDANNELKANDSETQRSADQDILHTSTPQEVDKTARQQPSTQKPQPNAQHKRFGSEDPEPEPIEDDPVANRTQDANLTPGVPNGTTTTTTDDDDDVSADDAPEAIGSKSVVKDNKPRLKALSAKKAKRKPKSSKAAKQKPSTAIVAPGPTVLAAGDALLLMDPSPENLNVSSNTPEMPLLHAPEPPPTQPETPTVATHQPSTSRKRKLFNFSETAKGPVDVVKAGVTYRTIPNEEPETPTSKKHKASHLPLPPKSNAGNWRLKKQALGRPKVQHVWGGRSAFVRT